MAREQMPLGGLRGEGFAKLAARVRMGGVCLDCPWVRGTHPDPPPLDMSEHSTNNQPAGMKQGRGDRAVCWGGRIVPSYELQCGGIRRAPFLSSELSRGHGIKNQITINQREVYERRALKGRVMLPTPPPQSNERCNIYY